MKRKWIIFGSILLSLALLLPFLILSVPGESEGVYRRNVEADPVTVLLLGKDEAAGNTDVILFLRYMPADHTLTVMQVPRDTYFESESGASKINHIFPAARAAGDNEREALIRTSDTLGRAFGISFDFAVSVSISAVGEIVDRIGGVPVTVPMAMDYTDEAQNLTISLPEGETVLDGQAAEKFLRFRSGYLMGDLGRVDAQKIFLLSFFKTLRDRMDFQTAISLLLAPPRGVVYSGDIRVLLPVVRSLFSAKEENSAQIFSVPGEATREDKDSGTWYYIVNKHALAEGLSTYFGTPNNEEDFDENGIFWCEKTHISDIYFAADQKIKVYSVDEISHIIIEKK